MCVRARSEEPCLPLSPLYAHTSFRPWGGEIKQKPSPRCSRPEEKPAERGTGQGGRGGAWGAGSGGLALPRLHLPAAAPKPGRCPGCGRGRAVCPRSGVPVKRMLVQGSSSPLPAVHHSAAGSVCVPAFAGHGSAYRSTGGWGSAACSHCSASERPGRGPGSPLVAPRDIAHLIWR